MRQRIARRFRKNIMRLGTIVREEALNRDEDGTLYPKKDRGYCVEAIVNGWHISAPDDNRYESLKSCLDAAKWAMEQKLGQHTEKEKE